MTAIEHTKTRTIVFRQTDLVESPGTDDVVPILIETSSNQANHLDPLISPHLNTEQKQLFRDSNTLLERIFQTQNDVNSQG